MSEIRTILVANRGEIAVRVIRTARFLGYRTVAVYSEADARALHVQQADEAILIGPGPVGQSYLDSQRILKAAADSGADAVHPGYGFLSENADFAQACEEAGLVFIGPTPEAIRLMGNKAEAKRRMIEAGVPCVPGYEDPDQSDDALLAAGEKIGLPLMVKAAAGGGGRGMRLVRSAADLHAAIKQARSEAKNAFGSDELILEKAIVRPRHVEIQVMADSHGNVIHLGERDCSVQRRHQKVIEEAPCPVMTPELRERMGAAAVEAARSIDYRGAGTIEFLLDADRNFYFLEMNTRLQVEHPVTEMVTGFDLVALQIRVAEGKPLGLAQDDAALTGHAIEVRLYAEDPAQDFLPSTGRVELWSPAKAEGVRFDEGIATGLEVSPFYDAMVAKVIAHGETREIARRRLVDALAGTALFGPSTNRDFLIECLNKPLFIAGEATTAFIAEEFGDGGIKPAPPPVEHIAAAAVLQYIGEREAAFAQSLAVSPPLKNWTSGKYLLTRYGYKFGDAEFDLTVATKSRDRYEVRRGEDALEVRVVSHEPPRAVLAIADKRHEAIFHSPEAGRLFLSIEGRGSLYQNQLALAGVSEAEGRGGRVTAPMHGQVIAVFVKAGDAVKKGAPLTTLEAMKMQLEILADVDGVVADVLIEAGVQVAAADLLMEIGPAED